ncbi:MAG TPA: preprotein translocase subunit SecE [Candidatus Peribacteraceae bacterium]|nr:preprotein translocase subunit SecE [Candidatus Peribacteraceae bacterium]
MNALMTYINESLAELRHVRWPTRQQAVRLSIIVIGFTLLCAIFFGVVDFLLSMGLKYVLSLAS